MFREHNVTINSIREARRICIIPKIRPSLKENKTMKNLITLALLLMLGTAQAREYVVSGPQDGLAMDVTLPDGFSTKTAHPVE